MAMMVALSSAVSGMQSEQTALDVIANNIANVNTTGYKAQTVTFSDILSQTVSAATAATDTTGSTNASQVGLGVSVASTTTDTSVGSTSSTSNWTDVALTGEGYYIVQTSSGEYAFTRDGSMSVDDEGNLTINGYLVCGWEDYTLDEDGNIVYNTDSGVEAINLYSDDYAGNKLTLNPEVTTTSSITGVIDSSDDVADTATGLTTIGDTTDLDFDATTEITVYDSQGNDYDVTVSMKKCAVEGDTTTWYWELSSDDTTISPSSGYIAFDADGNMITSATELSAELQDTAGYATADITVGTAVATGTYTVAVTGTNGDYTVTLTYPDGTTSSVSSDDGSATFGTGTSAIELDEPATASTGTTTFTVTSTAATAAISSTNTGTAAGYTSSNITASGVTDDDYTITVSGTSGSYTITLSDGTNTYSTTSTDGAAAFDLATLSSGTLTGTITLTAPTSLAAGKTNFSTVSDTTTVDTSTTNAGYTKANISATSAVASDDYTVSVTESGGTYTVTLSDGTNTYTTTSSTGAATFDLSTNSSGTATGLTGTITLTAPTSYAVGTTSFTITDTLGAAVDDAGYAYSDVAIGDGSAEGSYTITVAQNTSDTATWDITLTYPDGTSKTVTGSKDGSATFTTTAGTITLSAPDDIQAGNTTFTVDQESYTFDDTTTITITTPASAGTDDITVELDFTDLTTKDSTDSLSDTTDGYASGTASSYTISSDGTIYCTYDNDTGTTLAIGQIALAVFENAEGLEKIGDNLYSESLSSGDYDAVVAGTGGSGTMTSYAVELSNVDLASEFSNMMISQRAYQANSKMISTCDDMLQSLINMVG